MEAVLELVKTQLQNPQLLMPSQFEQFEKTKDRQALLTVAEKQSVIA